MFAGSLIKKQSLLNRFSGASVAYSLRDLGWYDSVIRVRRDSDNTESDFNAKQITNGDLLSFCGSGNGFVSIWYDQSGNNVNLEQSTQTLQPAIVVNGAITTTGGKPCIRAVNTIMQAIGANIPVAQRLMLCVFSMISQRDNARIFSLWDGVSVDYTSTNGYVFQQGNRDRNDEFGIFGSTSTSYYLSTGSRTTVTLQSLISESLYDSSGKLFKNGLEVTSDNTFTPFSENPINNLYLGYPWQSNGVSINVQELIYYGSNKEIVREQIESSINNYYQIF